MLLSEQQSLGFGDTPRLPLRSVIPPGSYETAVDIVGAPIKYIFTYPSIALERRSPEYATLREFSRYWNELSFASQRAVATMMDEKLISPNPYRFGPTVANEIKDNLTLAEPRSSFVIEDIGQGSLRIDIGYVSGHRHADIRNDPEFHAADIVESVRHHNAQVSGRVLHSSHMADVVFHGMEHPLTVMQLDTIQISNQGTFTEAEMRIARELAKRGIFAVSTEGISPLNY